jgi:hypothetical protein
MITAGNRSAIERLFLPARVSGCAGTGESCGAALLFREPDCAFCA